MDIATGGERGDPGGCRRSGGESGLWLSDGDHIGPSARQQQDHSHDDTDGQDTDQSANGPPGDSARRANSASGTRARPSFFKIVLDLFEFLSGWPPSCGFRILEQQHIALGTSRIRRKNSIILELEFHSTAWALNKLLTHDDSSSERRDDEIVQAYAMVVRLCN